MNSALTSLRNTVLIALFAAFIVLHFAGWLILPAALFFIMGWPGVLVGLLAWGVLVALADAVGFNEMV